MNNEWLQNIKIGDKFCTTEENNIYTVERLTKTQIITVGGSVFNRNTGKKLGTGEWHFEFMKELTLESRNKIRRQNMIRYIKNLIDAIDTLSNNDLEILYNLFKGTNK